MEITDADIGQLFKKMNEAEFESLIAALSYEQTLACFDQNGAGINAVVRARRYQDETLQAYEMSIKAYVDVIGEICAELMSPQSRCGTL